MFAIRKILHQTWPTQEMPRAIAGCVQSMILNNPGWRHCFYTDADWPRVLARNSIIDPETFLRFPTGIQKADLFRCIALYEEGGVYADADILAIRSLDDLLHAAIEAGLVAEDTEMILTTDHPVHGRLYYHDRQVIMNNFMVAVPGARFLGIYLERMKSLVKDRLLEDNEPVGTTGPIAMSDLIDQHGGIEKLKIALLPHGWINGLPDMLLQFEEHAEYDRMIRDGSWRSKLDPYLVHTWWHGYFSPTSTLGIYEQYLLNEQEEQ